jgi:outer membrane protein TolC
MCKLLHLCAFVLFLNIVCSAQNTAPFAAPESAPVDLTFQQALDRALAPNGNTGVQLAHESVQIAQSHYVRERANLLPDLDSYVAEQNQTVNLRSLGLRSQPNSPFVFPTEVGPFYTFDARIRLKETLMDFSTIRRLQAARRDVQVAQAGVDSSRERIAAAVAKGYAAALKADADVETAITNVSLAQSLLDSASRRESAGEGTNIEIARSKLKLARNRQHLLAARTVQTRAHLDLVKQLNLEWNIDLQLSGQLGSVPVETLASEEAAELALQMRADWREQQKRIGSAQLRYSAVNLERLPSLVGYGDYGLLSGVQTHLASVSLRLPLFDGGRLASDRAENLSLLRQERIKEKELRNQIGLEIRQAQASLASAREQLQVAEMALALAEEELARARRRYEAGVTNNSEVVDAEALLETARDDRVAAQFSLTQAGIELAQATGTIMKIKF